MSHIVKNSVVTIDYDVSDPEGTLLDAGEEPLIYLHGGYDSIFIAIEEALEGKKTGDTITVKLQPDQAYGEYDAGLMVIEPVDALPQPLAVGMQIEGEPDEESGEALFYRVTDIAEGKAVLDGNHPLAGMALVLTCTVMAVRPACQEEITGGQPLWTGQPDVRMHA